MMNAFYFWLNSDKNFKFLFLTLLPNVLKHSFRDFFCLVGLFVVFVCLFVKLLFDLFCLLF